MKRFGKLITLFVLVFTLCGMVNVSAMSESKLLEKLTVTYDINGYKYTLRDGDKVLAKRYLDLYNVSSSDCDYIAGKIDEAVGAMRDSGVTDFSDFSKLPSSLRTKLKQYVFDIADNTKVKATVKKGKVVIFNPDGSVFAEVSGLVKPTFRTMNVIAVVALCVSTIGAVLLVRNVKANA